MNDAVDFRTRFVNLRMDEDFAVPSATAINFHAIHVAHHDVVECDFIETITVWLHDEEGSVFG